MSHIDHDGPACAAFMVERHHRSETGKEEDAVVSFTWTVGEHKHTCTMRRAHQKPTPVALSFVFGLFIRVYAGLNLTNCNEGTTLTGSRSTALLQTPPLSVMADCVYNHLRTLTRDKTPAQLEEMDAVYSKPKSWLTKFASKRGFGEIYSKDGQNDLRAVRELLSAMKDDGAIVCFKGPGVPADHSTILNADAVSGLGKADMVIGFITRDQAHLLRTYGAVIALDATHNTSVFNRLKLITGLVVGVKDSRKVVPEFRGYPFGLFITNAENSRVFACIRQVVEMAAPGLDTKVIMSDMAFSAYNAWSTPLVGAPARERILWLWCGWHVWNALVKALKAEPRPENYATSDFGQFDSLIGSGVHELTELCFNEDIPEQVFLERLTFLAELFFLCGMRTMYVRLTDRYIPHWRKWCPAVRLKISRELFQDRPTTHPSLRTNNHLEGWHSALKLYVLGRLKVPTMISLLKLLLLEVERIRMAAFRAGALMNCPHELVSAMNDLADEADVFSEEVQASALKLADLEDERSKQARQDGASEDVSPPAKDVSASSSRPTTPIVDPNFVSLQSAVSAMIAAAPSVLEMTQTQFALMDAERVVQMREHALAFMAACRDLPFDIAGLGEKSRERKMTRQVDQAAASRPVPRPASRPATPIFDVASPHPRLPLSLARRMLARSTIYAQSMAMSWEREIF